MNKDELTLTIGKVTTAVKYKWDSDLNAIEFEYKAKKYNFKILFTEVTNRYILKSKDCLLLILDKK
jgi:hypothetical protein